MIKGWFFFVEIWFGLRLVEVLLVSVIGENVFLEREVYDRILLLLVFFKYIIEWFLLEGVCYYFRWKI